MECLLRIANGMHGRLSELSLYISWRGLTLLGGNLFLRKLNPVWRNGTAELHPNLYPSRDLDQVSEGHNES